MKRHDRSADRPSKDRFAKLLMAGIREAGDKREIVYDRSRFQLALGERGHQLHLQNVYADYCSAPQADREKALARIVRNRFSFEKSMPEEFEDASHDLMPSVRDRSYFASAELMLRAEDPRQPSEDSRQVVDCPSSRVPCWPITVGARQMRPAGPWPRRVRYDKADGKPFSSHANSARGMPFRP